MKMHNFGKVKLHTEYGALGSKEDFLDRAIDALSVLKISNSYLESTLAKEDANQKTLTTFTMIKKSILKIEAFLDSAKHEEKHLSKNHNEPFPRKHQEKMVCIIRINEYDNTKELSTEYSNQFTKK